MRRSLLSLGTAALFAALALTGCKSEPPTTVEGWAAALPELKDDQAVRDGASELRRLALEDLKAGKDLKALVPMLIPLLEEGPVVRQEVAYVLGRIGDPAAGDPLVRAIDFSAAVADKDAGRANSRVAEALGQLEHKAAVKPLLRLARSPDGFTALAAVEALGQIGDASAVGPLTKLATDDAIDPFISRNAIEALGGIGDASAMPALIEMLFRERRGVSFYRESSFAIFQIGQGATEKLIGILEGKDQELMAWAKSHNIFEAAVYAKTAQVLGDLADPRAVPALLTRLKYESDFEDLKLLPRVQSAEALGRIRDKRAVMPIASMLAEEEANVRGGYARALNLIGDRRVVPNLEKASVTGFGYDAREESQWGLARLGGAGDLKRYDAVTRKNQDVRTCTAWFECDPGANRAQCMKEMTAECNKRIETYNKRVVVYRPMLEVADECKTDRACWAAKLQDQNPRIREKAAWELGRTGDAKALDPVLAALKDDDLEARFAMISAVDALLFGANDGVMDAELGRAAAERIDALLAAEEGKVHTVKINEDLKRMTLKIKRALEQVQALKN